MGSHLFEELPTLLEKYGAQVTTMVNLAAQRAALAAGDALARETPVDTGVARSNWVATIDSPFAGVIAAYFPYPSYRVNHHEAVKTLRVKTRASVRTRRGSAFDRVRVSRSGRGPGMYGGL